MGLLSLNNSPLCLVKSGGGGTASTTVKITAILLNEDNINILGISSEGKTLELTLDAGHPTAEIEIIQGSPLVLSCSHKADISGTNSVNYFNPSYSETGADVFLYAVVFLDENLNPVTSGTLRISI